MGAFGDCDAGRLPLHHVDVGMRPAPQCPDWDWRRIARSMALLIGRVPLVDHSIIWRPLSQRGKPRRGGWSDCAIKRERRHRLLPRTDCVHSRHCWHCARQSTTGSLGSGISAPENSDMALSVRYPTSACHSEAGTLTGTDDRRWPDTEARRPSEYALVHEHTAAGRVSVPGNRRLRTAVRDIRTGRIRARTKPVRWRKNRGAKRKEKNKYAGYK